MPELLACMELLDSFLIFKVTVLVCIPTKHSCKLLNGFTNDFKFIRIAF